jgi:hypothetical protein
MNNEERKEGRGRGTGESGGVGEHRASMKRGRKRRTRKGGK